MRTILYIGVVLKHFATCVSSGEHYTRAPGAPLNEAVVYLKCFHRMPILNSSDRFSGSTDKWAVKRGWVSKWHKHGCVSWQYRSLLPFQYESVMTHPSVGRPLRRNRHTMYVIRWKEYYLTKCFGFMKISWYNILWYILLEYVIVYSRLDSSQSHSQYKYSVSSN